MSHVWVGTEYVDFARDLLQAYKFERAKDTAKLLARVIDEELPYIENDTVVTFVPTATSRVRQRGYDHAEELARQVARLRGLSCKRLLNRTGQSRQVGAKRQQRLKQLDSAFTVSARTNIKGINVLLVDDIVTTGASLGACAKILRQAGTNKVDGAVFAQKQ